MKVLEKPFLFSKPNSNIVKLIIALIIEKTLLTEDETKPLLKR